MQPISVEAFASMVMKNNKGYRKKELVKTLNETLTAKKNGAKCIICGAPIWAAGSAITGSNLTLQRYHVTAFSVYMIGNKFASPFYNFLYFFQYTLRILFSVKLLTLIRSHAIVVMY